MEEVQKPKLIKDLGMVYATKNSKNKKHYGIFECPYCGKHYRTLLYHVKAGNSKSCGCLQKQRAREAKTKHGDSCSRLYKIYLGMKKRCYNKNDKSFHEYGEQGITVCDEWLKDYINFKKWAINNGYSDNLTIDRIDNSKGYSPNNCRWADKFVQAQNKRKFKNTKFKYKGVSEKIRNGRTYYEAYITAFKKAIYLGSFNSPLECAKAYDNYVLENNLSHEINGVLQNKED